MFQDLCFLLDRSTLERIPAPVLERINEVFLACQKQIYETAQTEKIELEQSLAESNHKLDETTRRMLEMEMQMVKLRAEIQSPSLSPQKQTRFPHVKNFIMKKKLENAQQQLRNTRNGTFSGNCSDVDLNLDLEIRNLKKSIQEYQTFIYMKEQECYRLKTENNKLSMNCSVLEEYKSRYKVLQSAHFRAQFKIVDLNANLKQNQRFISEREQFIEQIIKTCLNKIYSFICDGKQISESKIVVDESKTVVNEINKCNLEVNQAKTVLFRIKDACIQLQNYVKEIRNHDSKDETNIEEITALKMENNELREYMDKLTEGCTPAGSKMDENSVEKMESEIEAFKARIKEVNDNQTKMEMENKNMEKKLNDKNYEMEQACRIYSEYINKQDELLKRYRKLKAIFINERGE